MIVAQAQKVREQLTTLKKLEEDTENRKDIEATFDELKRVAAALRQFSTLYQPICERLDAEKTSYITTQVGQIAKDIENSQQEFAKKRRQVKALQEANKEVKELTKNAEAGWKLYAESQLKPQSELLSLVRQLPEINKQLKEIDALIARLEVLTQNSPQNAAEVKEFDQKLGKLAERLSKLNLEPDIEAFLSNVLHGQATLADLSDEILDWCRQGDRAKTFKIAFR